MRPIAAALAVGVLVATVATGSVAAQNADPIEDLLTVEDGSAYDRLTAFVEGVIARLTAADEDVTDNEAADDLRSEFNRHNTSIQGWVNNRTTASTDADVLRLRLDADGDGTTATTFLVADVNGSDYANATMTDSTDREVDESCTLEDAAARNADDELDQFHDDIVADGEDVPADYRARLAGQYAGQVDCSFATRGDG